MSYRANAKEVAAVFGLAAPDRYGHFVRRVAAWGEAADEGGRGRRPC